MTIRDRRLNSKVQVFALALMGAGLILAGVALSALLMGNTRRGGVVSADDLSVVPAAVDFPAPALSLPNLSGQTETLTNYRGQVVLVNNWATWCPPCKAEMPTLQAYYEAHAAGGFAVIAIEAGSPAAEVREFAEAFGLTFPVWVDAETAALGAFQNAHLPNSYVIDRSGTVRLAWIGEISRAALEKHVTPLISEPR
jgi:cytochrome c biogenesis protein CcmG, thiol:disulfide interchange protein DsbE